MVSNWIRSPWIDYIVIRSKEKKSAKAERLDEIGEGYEEQNQRNEWRKKERKINFWSANNKRSSGVFSWQNLC